MATRYEWDLETWNADGDIEDHGHTDKLDKLPADHIHQAMTHEPLNSVGECFHLVLVRDVFRNNDLVNRSWAYVEDGALPTHFSDAYDNLTAPVPQRFVAELNTAKKRT